MSDLTAFTAIRPRLFAIAYRMLGVRADAEDVVQDAWLRWHGSDQLAVRSADAWLVTLATRLAIDRLRARQAESESYVGWWLPEPVIDIDDRTPESSAEMASEVSMAFLWVLERLSPEERAAFLMRQVFDHDYADIADILGKSEAACRQMVHRAQERVRQQTPRFDVPRDTHKALLGRFMAAAQAGDRTAMKTMMADDVQLVSDGGGKIKSFLRILRGAGRVAGVFWSLEHQYPQRVAYREARINGQPGLLRYVEGKLESAQSFVIEDGRIAAVLVVRNPDKLAGAPQLIF
ncbi:MAG TPA: RNA polymerase sigma-70 factor [Duganella sp.]|jgi:RNA polymerase sigma-70 factor (ECF subfamily)